MPLDDFFAKKDKKKLKKKQNPQELMEKLKKEGERTGDQENTVPVDATKTSAFGRDDEWEALDDEEKEIDLQSIRIGRLDLGTADENKLSKEKDKDSTTELDGEKKVWGTKTAEPIPEEEVEQVEQPVTEIEKNSRYVPIHLRPGGVRTVVAPKPQLDNTAEFPTLDAVSVPEPPAKVEVNQEQLDEENSWTTPGASRKPRDLPFAVSTQQQQPAYITPSQRQQCAPAYGRNTFSSSTFDDISRRSDSSQPFNRNGPNPRESSGFSNLDGWSRGSVVNNTPATNSRPSFPIQPSKPRTFNPVASDWVRNVADKNDNEASKGDAVFELSQSNRFAGLSET